MDWRHIYEVLTAGREVRAVLKNLCEWINGATQTVVQLSAVTATSQLGARSGIHMATATGKFPAIASVKFTMPDTASMGPAFKWETLFLNSTSNVYDMNGVGRFASGPLAGIGIGSADSTTISLTADIYGINRV